MSVVLMEMFVDEQKQIDGNLSNSDRVRNIFSQFKLLDGRRQFMFREWLFNHSCTLNRSDGIQSGLTACLEAMPIENAQWEYRLMLDEIEWWCALDERVLGRMLIEHFDKRCSG
jgi:hypothetical protein